MLTTKKEGIFDDKNWNNIEHIHRGNRYRYKKISVIEESCDASIPYTLYDDFNIDDSELEEYVGETVNLT